MDTVGLIALLREAAPTAQLEDAPGIDLQPTIYAARDDMPSWRGRFAIGPSWRSRCSSS
jgi:hypothetical protein